MVRGALRVIGSLYLPGDTVLHRLGAAPKLGGLFVAGLALFLVGDPAVLAAGALAASLVLAAARPAVRELARQLRGVALVMAAIFAVNLASVDAATAWAVLFRLWALVAAALAVTMTTRTADMLDAVERALAPFERLGLLDAAKVGLAVALTLRFVPRIFGQYREIRDAQAARGIAATPLAVLVPLLVRTLKGAEDIAAAIDARGFNAPRPTREKDAC